MALTLICAVCGLVVYKMGYRDLGDKAVSVLIVVFVAGGALALIEASRE